MNKTISILIFFTLNYCNAQIEFFTHIDKERQCYWTEELVLDNPEAYSKEYLDSTILYFPKSFILEIVPGNYRIDTVEFDNTTIEKLKIDSVRYRVTTYRSEGFRFNHRTSECYLKQSNKQGHHICYGDVVSEMKIVTESELIASNNEIEIKNQISESKLVKIFLEKKPDSLKPNQRYIQKGYYSKFSTIGHICDPRIDLWNAKTNSLLDFLSSQGYQINDSKDNKDKLSEALKDFQVKNNITEELGQLDYKTTLYIEKIQFIKKLISIGYEIDENNIWTEQASKALIDFQIGNSLTNVLGEYDSISKRQMEKVEYIPKLIDAGYVISDKRYWNEQANNALIDYQIKYNLLTYIGDLDHYTKEHLRNNVLSKTPVDNNR